MAVCKECDENFEWQDDVIQVGDNFYHKDCVEIYPTGYSAFIGDDYLGETENHDGSMACEFFPDLLDEDEEQSEDYER